MCYNQNRSAVFNKLVKRLFCYVLRTLIWVKSTLMSQFCTCLLSALGRVTLIKLVCKLFYLVTCFIVQRHRRPFRYVTIGSIETCLIRSYRNQLMQCLICILSRICFAIFKNWNLVVLEFKVPWPLCPFRCWDFLVYRQRC